MRVQEGRCRSAGHMDDERNAGAGFEERTSLRPLAFLAELIAVIGDEDDDGVVAQLEAIKSARTRPRFQSAQEMEAR